jgi:hypothetical protein
MSNEYWLQKKTLGGWSHVTWYAIKEEAKLNFDRVSAGDSGYSWRLVKIEVIEQKLLDEVIEVEPLKDDGWKLSEGTKAAIGWGDIPSTSFKRTRHDW